MRIVVDMHAAAPRERVFALSLDIPRWPELIGAIDRIELLTPGPVGVGTRFRETRRMFGREASEEMTVAEITAPERFVLTACSNGTAYRAEHHFATEPGGTRLTLVFNGSPQTIAARLLRPLALALRGTITRPLAADLADLKRAAEAPDATRR